MKNGDIRQQCSACGTSPVNHHLLFILNLLDETLGKVNNRVFSFTTRGIWRKISDLLEKIIFTTMSLVGLARFNNDPELAVTGRSKLIYEEAIRRGIKMEQMVILGKPIEFYRARLDGKLHYFQSLPVPPSIEKNGHIWLDDKFILFKKLKEAGIPAPSTKKIFALGNTENNIKKILEEMNRPLIVKPKNGSRSRHTTTNIKTEDELLQAINIARQITLFPVIQEHLYGSVYRATVINEKLVGFYRADPPFIIGDGVKTIKELIQNKNETRHERLSDILINEDLIFFIKRSGYKIDDLLPENTKLELSAKTGRMYGGYTREMLPEIHSDLFSIFEKAGRVVDAPVVGFDLIMEDPTRNPKDQRWGIIECNSLPFIDLHYFALEGTPINLAENVWDLWK